MNNVQADMNAHEKAVAHYTNAQIIHDESYNQHIKWFFTELDKIENVQDKISFIRSELHQLRTDKLACEKDWLLKKSPAFRIENSNWPVLVLDKLIELVESQFSQYVEVEKLEKKLPTKKLTWSGGKNILYDIFIQCKENPKTKEIYIPNKLEEIAEFIKDGFTGFESTSLATIATELARTERPKKVEKLIDVIDTQENQEVS